MVPTTVWAPARRVRKKIERLGPVRYDVAVPQAQMDLGPMAAMPNEFKPTNPSFVTFGKQRLVCVRGVDYLLENEFSLKHSGSEGVSINRFFLLDWQGRSPTLLPELGDEFAGAEDVRLFRLGEDLHAVYSPGTRSAYRGGGLVVSRLRADLRGVAESRFLPSPFGFPVEKNWAPFVKDGRLYFVYSLRPLLVLACNLATGALSTAGDEESAVQRSDLRFIYGGSSPGIQVSGGWLFLFHRRSARLGGLRRIYTHNLVFLSPNLRTASIGRAFVIGRPSIQFVAGLSLEDERLMIGYGFADQEAALATFDKKPFLERFAPRRMRSHLSA